MMAGLLLTAVPPPHWAQAADITVDGTVCTLAEAIDSANNDSAAGNGCADGSGDDSITLQSDVILADALPIISSTINIDGGGHAIDGNGGDFPVLMVSDLSTANLTLNKATVTGANHTGAGGGIFNATNGTLTLINSTVSGNTGAIGGGIINYGTLTLLNSTVSGNTATDTGGGIASASGIVTLKNSIISGNTADWPNEIYGDITSSDFNLFGHSGETDEEAFYLFTPGSTDVNGTSDGTNTDLAAILNTTLTDNGGQAQTHALVAGSPAIDLDVSCNGDQITTDQRGYSRPVGSGCDAGAFEYGATTLETVGNMVPMYQLLLMKQ
ncbi:MAG: hypothetical protein D3925_12095 [Candidatus Electrothrix sp. AR5]|nr:hypothetical protein [Candidatus Electrothrix sp. AR5]